MTRIECKPYRTQKRACLLQIVCGLGVALFVAETQPAKATDAQDQTRVLAGLGYQHHPYYDRVFVQSQERVSYTAERHGERLLVLHLANARFLRQNDTRLMDTRFFKGVVSTILPLARDDITPSVSIQIDLLRDAEFRIEQTDTILAVLFAPKSANEKHRPAGVW